MSSIETVPTAVPATRPPFINLSAYRFTPLHNLPGLKDQLRTLTLALGMRGTILLSPKASTCSSPAPAKPPTASWPPSAPSRASPTWRRRRARAPNSRSTACW
jgi:hypothetical protein